MSEASQPLQTIYDRIVQMQAQMAAQMGQVQAELREIRADQNGSCTERSPAEGGSNAARRPNGGSAPEAMSAGAEVYALWHAIRLLEVRMAELERAPAPPGGDGNKTEAASDLLPRIEALEGKLLTRVALLEQGAQFRKADLDELKELARENRTGINEVERRLDRLDGGSRSRGR